MLLLQFFLLFMVHAYSGLVVGKGPERKIIGDGPWHWLLPCLVPWLLLQTATSMGWLHNVTGTQSVGLFSIDVVSCLVGTSKHAIRPFATSGDAMRPLRPARMLFM